MDGIGSLNPMAGGYAFKKHAFEQRFVPKRLGHAAGRANAKAMKARIAELHPRTAPSTKKPRTAHNPEIRREVAKLRAEERRGVRFRRWCEEERVRLAAQNSQRRTAAMYRRLLSWGTGR